MAFHTLIFSSSKITKPVQFLHFFLLIIMQKLEFYSHQAAIYDFLPQTDGFLGPWFVWNSSDWSKFSVVIPNWSSEISDQETEQKKIQFKLVNTNFKPDLTL